MYLSQHGVVLEDDFKKYSQNFPIIKTPKIPTERLIELNKRAYKEFYYRPKYVLKQIKSIRNPTYLLKGFKVIKNWIKS